MNTYVTDLTIKLKKKSRYYNLPYATDESTPTFRWDLPYGITQVYYCFEMRTLYPKNLSTGEYLCAYYSSGKIRSSVPEHTISFVLNDSVWNGCVEVRLRVYDDNENIYSTHKPIEFGEDVSYDFEQNNPQGFWWYANKKEYYFCFDKSINAFLNVFNFNYYFQKANDYNDQDLVYTMQVSDSPLFNDVEDNEVIFIERNNISFTGNSISIVGAFQKEDDNKVVDITSLKPNKMYFIRVRAYDGYDYSDWSTVNAFYNVESEVPICYIKNVDSVLAGEERPYGEVKVTVQIVDKDNDFVNSYFCFSMPTTEAEASRLGVAKNDSIYALSFEEEMASQNSTRMIRARFKESTLSMPTNQDIVLTWMTNNEIIGAVKNNVYLYMIAEDTYSPSSPVNYGPISIDNTKIGIGAATSPATSFNIRSDLQFHFRYLQLPDTILRTRHNLKQTDLSYDDKPEKSIREASNNWLEFWKNNERNSQSFAITVKNDKFYSVCPDCDYTYNWVYDTYEDKSGWALISTSYSEMELITEEVDRNTLQFRCKKCGKVYPMEWRYRPDLHIGIYSYLKKENYALYHGYNSNSVYDDQMKLDLELLRKSEYDALYENDESAPKFNQIEDWKENIKNENGSDAKESWGYVGKSPLLTMTRRPDIDSYHHVIPPNPKHHHYAVYVDGQSLHMDVNKDYMTDYEDKMDHNQNIIPGDKSMQKLAKQEPWNSFQVLNDIYIKKGIKENGDKKGKTIYCESNDSVVYYNDINQPYFFYRAVFYAKSEFPFTIKRNVNDRYMIQINDEFFSGSVLEEGENSRFVAFVGDESYQSIWKNFYNKVLGRAFDFSEIFDLDSNSNTARIKYYGKNDKITKRIKLFPALMDKVKTDNNGNPILDENLNEIHEIQDVSCYEILGIGYFEAYQNWHYIKKGTEVRCETFGDNENNTGKYYYYSNDTDENKKEGYGIVESEINNEISDFQINKNQQNNQESTTVSSAIKVTFASNTNTSLVNWSGRTLRINHNMSCYPFVTLYDEQNRQVFYDTKFVNKDTIYIDIPSMSGTWTAILGYGVPYGKFQYVTDTFYSKLINFTNSNSSNVTWQNGKAIINHKMNCYPAIMLYDGNQIQSFFGAKILDGNNISIDFKNLLNVNGDWRIILNKTYDYNDGKDNEQFKRIIFTSENDTFVSWNGNEATFLHGLDCYPIVSIYDENMELALFEVKIINANRISVNFGDRNVIKNSWTLFALKTLGYNENSQEVVYNSSGEPLFTCYLDEVDKEGHHFPYTEQDYFKTKQIYVRTKHYEICNPFEHPIYGYRNWIVEPIPGKEGRYRKKKVLNSRGLPVEKKYVATRDEDNHVIYEFGWFNPTTNECVSHEKVEDTFTDKGEQIYEAKTDYKWQNEIMTQVCIVYDYVDYQQAIIKNPTDTLQYHPLNHKSSILVDGNVEKYRFDKKYGLYILGEYRQRKVDTFGNQIIYDEDKIVLRYPNGEFVYNESDCQLYRKNGRIIWYDLNGREQEEENPENYAMYSVPATELKIYDNNGVKLEYDQKGNQYLKVRKRFDTEYDINGHFVYNHKLDDQYVYDNNGNCILRDEQGEFYFMDSQKVYVEGFEKISVPVISLSKDAYSFNTETNDSSTFKCTVVDENGNQAYEYDGDEIAVDENGNKKKIYFEQTQIKRFDESWKFEKDDNYLFSELVIDNNVPKFSSIYGIFFKYGYQPEKCLEPYFKEDTTKRYEGQSISKNSIYVHGIYNEPWGDLRVGTLFQTLTTLISDKTLENVGTYLYDNFYYHEEKGVFYKGELLDYRIYGNHIWELKNYFSGLPKDEHVAYAIRPDVVYREDRPWRIVSSISGLENYGKWSFLYLQSTWNAYNRIHWNFTAGTGEYVILTAVELINNIEGTPFSVKTKRSIWDSDLNMWCIPFSDTEKNSDMIDTLNNTNFINGHYYRFYIKTINKSNGVESAESPYSITFTTSPDAVSPATITDMSYDPWTKLLMVKFRLDDALGRKYDVVGIKYSIKDPTIGEDNSDGTWYDIPLNTVEGELNSLGSNTRGDNVPSNNYITYNTIYIDLNQIGEIISSDFRIRLITEIAANRNGLTIPNFHAKMSVNEFLDPVEKTIYSLAGTWNRWVWKSSMNYETGESSGEWIYLDDPIWQDGKIQQLQKSLDEMDDEFEEWYASVAKFRYPDMDAFEYYLHTAKDASGKETQYELFYYTYFFEDYINLMQLREQYLEYRQTVPMSYTIAKTNKSFLEKYNQNSIYQSFYTTYREKYLSMKMQDMKNTDFMMSFLSWYESNKSQSYAYARKLYMDGYRLDESGEWNYNEEESLWDKYNAFWSEDSSTSESLEEFEEESSNSESDYEMTEDDKIITFLKSEKLEKTFENYYVQLYMYPDTRFSEREQLVGSVYDEFEVWLKSPEDEYGNTITFDYFDNLPENSTLGDDRYISEQYIYFLRWAKVNEIINNISVTNQGKNTARIAFMQLKKNGISYNQMYQSITTSKQNCYEQLEEAQNQKIIIETDHRKNLVSQGFFSNGFLNNKPYKSNGETNIAFRFRVETQPYEGSISDYMKESFEQYSSMSDLDDSIDYGGYDERWNVYFRVQMDFYDTFNSQSDLKPLRDFIYIGKKSDDNRIKAAIGDADNSANTTPVSSVDTEENTNEVATNERANKQFAASWTILKKDLPGEYDTDMVPYGWGDSFEQLYFWRVAPYNLVKRPIFESLNGLFTTPAVVEYENGFIPDTYHSYTVNNVVNFNKEHVENNAPGVIHEDYPPKPNQSQNQTRLYKIEAYLNNTFANEDITESFTDSKNTYVEYKSLNNDISHGYKAQYFIYLPTSVKNVNGTWTKDVNDSAFNAQAKPYASEWINQAMLNRGEVQFVTDRPRKFVEIEEESSSSESSSYSETREMEFIKDNIENFDTKWIPWNVERKKQNVIYYNNHYLLFSHKHDAIRNIDGKYYEENYIVMSRGFDPCVFGEECITFPRYSNYRPSQIIPNALSFENPSICFYNLTYYMYFNVLFYDENKKEFYTEIYRAETLDMDTWTNFTKVNIKYKNSNLLNIGEPNVLIMREVEYSSSSSGSEEEITETYKPSYHLFASAKLTDYPTSIHYWISEDGINFEYQEEIAWDINYGCYSPSVIIDDRGRMKVYFSIENNTHEYGIIASVKKDHDLYYQESHPSDWQPIPFVEKSDYHKMMSNFEGIQRWDAEGSYLKPCVLYDNHYGYQVMRLYYNSYDNPYIYDKTNDLILNEFVKELTIHTEYLEQYQWKQKELREFADANNNIGNVHIDPISMWDGEKWVNIAQNKGNVNAYNPNFRLPNGLLRFQWFDTTSNIPVVKISSHPVNNYIRCLSQAPWIDFYNVANTEAIIYPETLEDTEYKLTNYKYSDFMLEEELFDAYNEWFDALPQEEKEKYEDNYDASYVAFLTAIQRLGDYMWWSRKGNGVYRHLNILKEMDYNGATEKDEE